MIAQANREVQNYELTKLYEKIYINIGDVILDNRFILRKYPEIYKVLHDLTKYCLLVNLLLDSDKDLAEQIFFVNAKMFCFHYFCSLLWVLTLVTIKLYIDDNFWSR